MNRSLLILSLFCAANIAAGAPPSPTPKAISTKSSAPAAISAINQNTGKSANPSGDTKILCTYKGPGYFDADLALKLRNALSPKPSSSAPVTAPAAVPQGPVARGTSLVSRSP
jgi:hypothetical protein